MLNFFERRLTEFGLAVIGVLFFAAIFIFGDHSSTFLFGGAGVFALALLATAVMGGAINLVSYWPTNILIHSLLRHPTATHRLLFSVSALAISYSVWAFIALMWDPELLGFLVLGAGVGLPSIIITEICFGRAQRLAWRQPGLWSGLWRPGKSV